MPSTFHFIESLKIERIVNEVSTNMATMTNQQYQQYVGRMRRGMRGGCDVPLANGIHDLPKESDLHNQIIHYCKSKGWQYLHGSMAHRSRRTLGEPDFLVLADRGRLFMVECKTKTGKLSMEQQGFIAHAAKNGHVVHVVKSMEEFVKLLV